MFLGNGLRAYKTFLGSRVVKHLNQKYEVLNFKEVIPKYSGALFLGTTACIYGIKACIVNLGILELIFNLSLFR